MYTITNIHAREILDSRGNPTIEVEVTLEGNIMGRAQVPAGASMGVHEAHELRDGGTRYQGKGVLRAVHGVVFDIRNALLGKTVDQKGLDEALCALDGTPLKERLGANAILGMSLAFAHAAAQKSGQPLYEYARSLMTQKPHGYVLPVPLMNVLNGGAHAPGTIDIQEIMLVPAGAPSFAESVRCVSEIFYTLHDELKHNGQSVGVGDEGGFAVPFHTNTEALDTLMRAINTAGYRPGVDVFLALDVAASQLYTNGVYTFTKDHASYNTSELIAWYESLVQKYPIVSIEDGFAEDDWEGFGAMTKQLGNTIQIVGDDLFVTNVKRLQEGIDRQAANAIIIKPNQIGTVWETLQTVQLAQQNHITPIMSHRSGETEDTTIADLAIGWGVLQIKSGSVSRGERVAKYNQLLRIEEELGSRGLFAGKQTFPRIKD